LLADNIITLNSNFTSGTPSEDAGIEVLRGGSTTKKFFWDESADRWYADDGLESNNLYLSGVANPTIFFNGSSDAGIDMAIKATPEGLDFYEPEDGNKIHFQVLDDTGVNAVYGYKLNGTEVIDTSRNLVNIGTINTGQGATEVHLMNQNIRTSDSPTFVDLNLSGGGLLLYSPNGGRLNWDARDQGDGARIHKWNRNYQDTAYLAYYENWYDGNSYHSIGIDGNRWKLSDGLDVSGTLTATSIDTGQGATEVYLMNQNLRTSDSPTFVGLTLSSTLDFGSSNANIKLSRGGFITFYEDGNARHSIGSRNASGAEADDLRINSYGAVYINLDSNNNNTSGADFEIGRHGNDTGTISNLFTLSGETGEATFANVVNATAVNTGQGDNELYAMNQNVRTSDNVTFNQVNATFVGNVQGTADRAEAVDSNDTRGTNDLPNSKERGVYFDFKSNATNGLSDGGAYNGQMHWRSYGGGSDLSGGYPIQISYTASGRLWSRLGTGTTTWGSWRQILDSVSQPYAYNMNQNVRTSDSPTFSNLYIDAYLYHSGDTNTYLRMVGGDDMQLVAGGRQMLRMDEGTNPDVLELGDSSTITRFSSWIGYGTGIRTSYLYIRGGGNNNVVSRLVYINGSNVASNSRGLQLTIIRASDLAVVSTTSYDTYGSSTASNNLANAINGVSRDQIGILTSYDAWELNVTGNLRTAALNVGLTKLGAYSAGGSRRPYAAIFHGTNDTGNATTKDVIERMESDDADANTAAISTTISTDGSYISIGGVSSTNALYSAQSTTEDPTVIVDSGNNVIIGQTAISYTSSDNSGVVYGGPTNNKLHINGSIQLTGNSDAIVFGRGTATFLKDEELGFGWGGGWYMQDSTYLRARNNKIIYTTGEVRGSLFRDAANDSYYLDPDSFSQLYTVRAVDAFRSDRYENTVGQFLFRDATSSGPGRHLNLWDSTGDPSQADGTVTGISWGRRSDSQPYYMIYTDKENYNGNYSKLRINWHTGIQIGASQSYGGTRFYNDSRRGTGGGSEIFSVGRGDSHVRVNQNLYVSTNNTTGQGIFLADDGSIVDNNDAYVTMRFTYGVRITNDNNSNTTITTLSSGRSGSSHTYFHSDQARNIGWGTTTPQAPIHLYRSGLGGNTGYTDMLRLEINRSDHGAVPSGPSILFKDQDTNNSTNEARISMMTVNDSDYGDNDEAASNLLFDTTNGGSSSTKMIITGRGNIGINTVNPGYKLDVNGNVRAAYYDINNSSTRLEEGSGNALRMRTNSGYVDMGPMNTSYAHFQTDRGNFYFNRNTYIDGTLYTYSGNTRMEKQAIYSPIYYDVNSPGYYGDFASTSRMNVINANQYQLPQNPVGVNYGSGASAVPPYYIGQQRGDNDAWKIYGESPAGSNTGTLVLQSEDDYDNNERIVLRFKRTYSGYPANDTLDARYNGAYINGFLQISSSLNAPGNIFIQNTSPTIYLRDTDHRSSMIHQNSNIFYVLRGSGNNSTTWSTYNGYWPLELRMDNNNATFGGAVTAIYNMDAESFRDRNNTGYFLNPASDRSSNINGFTSRTKDTLGITGKYNRPRSSITGDTNYWTGAMGWGREDFNTVMTWGSGFFDTWSNPANEPPDTSHYVGVQAYHYTNAYNSGYGWQMAGGVTDSLWWRHSWPNNSGWFKIAMYENNASTGNFYATRYYDSNSTSYYGDFASVSYMNDLRVNIMYDRENTSYYFGSGQGSARANTMRAWEFYADNWFRNYNSGEGLYNQATAMHWYSDSNRRWRMYSTQSTSEIYITTSGNNLRGYVYADNSNNIGFLDSDGNWAVRVARDSYVELRDNNEVTFRAGQGGVDGNYGTVQTHGGGKGGWEGYSINARYVFMSADSSQCGIYNDIDNEWMFYAERNGNSYMYHNGTWQFYAASYGMYVRDQVRANIYYDHNTSYYMNMDSVSYVNDFRPNIIYDRNNTGYYVNGDSTSRMYRINANYLYAYGWVYAQDNVIAYYSDERLKDKIGNIENPLDKILSLNGFYYTNNELAKSVGYTKEEKQLGLSAQEVQAILPEIVHLAPFDTKFDEDGNPIGSKSGENYLTIDYDKLVPLLVEGIKEQNSIVKSQNEKIEYLSKEVSELKDMVNKLINK